MRPILCGALLAFATLSPAAYAQSAQAEDSGQWSGRAQFGLSQNSGTTDFVALTIENDAKFDAMKLTADIKASLAVHSSRVKGRPTDVDEGSETVTETTTTQHYIVHAASRYQLASSLNFTAKSGWERNPHHGIDARLHSVLGLGLEFGAKDVQTFRAEAVGGAFFERDREKAGDTFAVAGVLIGYHRHLGERGSFSTDNDVMVNLEDPPDVLWTSRSSVQAALTGRTGIAITHRLVWDNRPSEVEFDPSGSGRLTTEPGRLQSTVTASLTVQW